MALSREEKINWGVGLGSIVLFLIGMRRTSGALTVGNGARQVYNGKELSGYTNLVVGGSFLLFPSWPDTIGDFVRKKLLSSNSPKQGEEPRLVDVNVNRRVGQVVDELIDGDWTILDMREARDASTAARAKTLKEGDIASLVLQSSGGPPMVFNVKVIGGSAPPRYQAQWVTKAPAGGPQMASFSEQHVYAIH